MFTEALRQLRPLGVAAFVHSLACQSSGAVLPEEDAPANGVETHDTPPPPGGDEDSHHGSEAGGDESGAQDDDADADNGESDEATGDPTEPPGEDEDDDEGENGTDEEDAAPVWSGVDINPSSPSYGQEISTLDYLGTPSLWVGVFDSDC